MIIPLKRGIVGRIGKTIGQNIFARSVGGRNWEKGRGEGRKEQYRVQGYPRGGKKKRKKKIGGEGEIVDFERLNEKVERCRTRGGGEGGEGGSSGIAAHRHVSE